MQPQCALTGSEQIVSSFNLHFSSADRVEFPKCERCSAKIFFTVLKVLSGAAFELEIVSSAFASAPRRAYDKMHGYLVGLYTRFFKTTVADTVLVIMADEGESTTVPKTDDNPLVMRLIVRMLNGKWQNVKNMTTLELHERIVAAEKDPEKEKVVVLDARPPEEYDVSHVIGAIRVAPDGSDAKQTLETLTTSNPAGLTVVCVCSVGYRSMVYATELQKQTAADNRPLVLVSYCSLGYRGLKYADAVTTEQEKVENGPPVSAYNLEGGLFKWANENRPMTDHKNRPTIYAHPYSAIWGKWLNYNLRRSTPEP
ncbi:hypothetical protein LSAT2_018570 [Lamellibrachia satsuma]|nr:hypothetical protein LSAT2_018570 [Lamellibrachia satsuma]